LYKNDSGLALTQTYTLEGFSLEENSSILVSLSDYKVLNDVKLYTVFKEISVYDNIHENWFTYANDEVSGVTGKRIARKSGVNLKGKITLPATYNGSPVIGTSEDGFKDCTDITHIFIGKNNEGKSNFMHIRS
jgi:hypothetical protein